MTLRFPESLAELALPTLPVAETLAAEEVLLARFGIESGSGSSLDCDAVHLWQADRVCVVLGRNSSVTREVHVDACDRDGVPIYRRSSGGGVVLLGPGCLAYSLFLKQAPETHLHSIASATRAVMESVRDALRPAVPELSLDGISDLTIGGVKVSGNAQRWSRTHLLHHGTLLCDFDLDLIGRYLGTPLKQPDYRENRSHAEFVRNLPLNVRAAWELLTSHWRLTPRDASVDRSELAQPLAERYANEEWIRRR